MADRPGSVCRQLGVQGSEGAHGRGRIFMLLVFWFGNHHALAGRRVYLAGHFDVSGGRPGRVGHQTILARSGRLWRPLGRGLVAGEGLMCASPQVVDLKEADFGAHMIILLGLTLPSVVLKGLNF